MLAGRHNALLASMAVMLLSLAAPASASLIVWDADWTANSLQSGFTDPASDSSDSLANLLAIDTSVGQATPAEIPDEQIESFSNSPLGMATTPNSLSQVTGGGISGIALAATGTVTLADSLEVHLGPESRMILPRGPTYRWFRPPRV